MFKLLATLVIAIVPALVFAGDDTLLFYLSKSDVVLVVESLDDFGQTGRVTVSDGGFVLNEASSFKVLERIKGKATEGERLSWNIEIPTDDAARTPWIKKGEKYILFLDARTGGMADLWFGVQRYSPAMAKNLARVAKEAEGRKPAR